MRQAATRQIQCDLEEHLPEQLCHTFRRYCKTNAVFFFFWESKTV